MRFRASLSVALRALSILLLCGGAGGCYYLQAASGQWQVLAGRESIEDVLARQDTPAELAERLRLVQEARRFSIDELSLPDNGSYRSYSDIGREFVLWNVFAAPEFSLRPKTWCFPIAGCVSYRGYFSRDAAYRKSRALARRGYDVAVGGVSAYSTLGNFDDPVLSSMMRWEDIRLVAVLFHELAHQVLYIKGDSAFNESFATAVEEFGVERWLEASGRERDIAVYRERRELRQALMSLVAAARTDLGEIYAAPVADDEKREKKQERLERLSADAVLLLEEAGRQGSDWLSGELNNARLVSMALYEGRLPGFRALFDVCADDIRCFYTRAQELSKREKQRRDAALDELAGGNL